MFRPVVAAAALALICTVARADGPQGYLPAGAIDAARVIGPPPEAGSLAEAADFAAYQAAAAGVGTPRWIQAREDDDEEIPVVLLVVLSSVVVTLVDNTLSHELHQQMVMLVLT